MTTIDNSTRLLYVFLLFLALCSISCGPTVYYLGDSYTPTTEVAIFYDEKDVERAYTTMGRMTHDQFINYSPEIIREEMVKEARLRGADAIIFTALNMNREYDLADKEREDRVQVEAKLIRYKE